MSEGGTIRSEHPVELKFDGRLREVDVTAFGQVLLDFAEVAKAANRRSGSNANLDVRITATGEGCFEAFLKLVLANPDDTLYLTAAGLGVIEGIFGATVGVYKLHKWLAGRKIKPVVEEGDAVMITDNAGNSTTIAGDVYNLYFGDKSVSEAIARTFGALNETPAITGFKIRGADEANSFTANRNEFDAMASVPAAVTEAEATITETVEADLRILKVILDRSYTRKWEFFYLGQKISANITDERFFDKVEAGMPFAKGDSLRVEMDILKERDETLGVAWIRGYTIRDVKEHLERSDTTPLF